MPRYLYRPLPPTDIPRPRLVDGVVINGQDVMAEHRQRHREMVERMRETESAAARRRAEDRGISTKALEKTIRERVARAAEESDSAPLRLADVLTESERGALFDPLG